MKLILSLRKNYLGPHFLKHKVFSYWFKLIYFLTCQYNLFVIEKSKDMQACIYTFIVAIRKKTHCVACKLTVYSNSCEVKYKAMGHYFKWSSCKYSCKQIHCFKNTCTFKRVKCVNERYFSPILFLIKYNLSFLK